MTHLQTAVSHLPGVTSLWLPPPLHDQINICMQHTATQQLHWSAVTRMLLRAMHAHVLSMWRSSIEPVALNLDLVKMQGSAKAVSCARD